MVAGKIWLGLIGLNSLVCAQTYTHCNPLKEVCEPNPALGKSVSIDFLNDGPNRLMQQTGTATIVYDPYEGALFSVVGSKSNPVLQSKLYIMYGKVTVTARAAKGAGVVSSIVLQSDDLDEIDVEFVGNDSWRFQSNYYGKGCVDSYKHGRYHTVTDCPVTSEFHTYTVEWTPNAIKWYVGGRLVRTLKRSEDPKQYPQTPMNLRVGAWAAGDRSNPAGTVDWAGGLVDYSKGPYVYAIKSIEIEDYSTGASYQYTDQSGDASSICAIDGQIYRD